MKWCCTITDENTLLHRINDLRGYFQNRKMPSTDDECRAVYVEFEVEAARCANLPFDAWDDAVRPIAS